MICDGQRGRKSLLTGLLMVHVVAALWLVALPEGKYSKTTQANSLSLGQSRNDDDYVAPMLQIDGWSIELSILLKVRGGHLSYKSGNR